MRRPDPRVPVIYGVSVLLSEEDTDALEAWRAVTGQTRADFLRAALRARFSRLRCERRRTT